MRAAITSLKLQRLRAMARGTQRPTAESSAMCGLFSPLQRPLYQSQAAVQAVATSASEKSSFLASVLPDWMTPADAHTYISGTVVAVVSLLVGRHMEKRALAIKEAVLMENLRKGAEEVGKAKDDVLNDAKTEAKTVAQEAARTTREEVIKMTNDTKTEVIKLTNDTKADVVRIATDIQKEAIALKKDVDNVLDSAKHVAQKAAVRETIDVLVERKVVNVPQEKKDAN